MGWLWRIAKALITGRGIDGLLVADVGCLTNEQLDAWPDDAYAEREQIDRRAA